MLEWEPTVRTSKSAGTDASASDPVEELDLGWVTTNRRASQAKPKSAIVSDDEDEEEDDDDVDMMGEREVDVKRAEQKRIEKDLQREAHVSRPSLLAYHRRRPFLN